MLSIQKKIQSNAHQEMIGMIMIDKTLLKNTINVIVSILLFIAYVHLFGTHSMKKYLEKEIIITEQEDENEGGCGAKQLPGLFNFFFLLSLVCLQYY